MGYGCIHNPDWSNPQGARVCIELLHNFYCYDTVRLFFLENEWRLAGFYSAVSLLGGIPMVVIGQLVTLQGTQAILRGITAQDLIVDRDISENLTVD